ncbi:hypothetical protein [Acinetobacter silvestris]|uniref:Replication protein n=1 Tax=Acinetobacter silvestris TaxID=1977882 RepID=A0A1Y3CG72_9GAMM|nr:hypothetical protein [Acinetobacter silvestris]OTG66090.1 hypothetical protein B9T28_06335 [Acinetobacter silvestris]
MSIKFDRGYVMSSRLYRYEVRPFLSDAAKNIYAELEDRINGYKDKKTDHVSYSQLQGGKLEGSKKLSTTTVAKGLKELLELGVISIVTENSRKGNEYQINEVSLVDHFSNESTTLESKVLQKVKRQHFSNESASTLESKDTIELLYRITFIELLNNTIRAKNPLQVNFFEYQEIKKQNLLDQQKLEVEQKVKSAAERKEKTRKLSFDEVMDLTKTNIQKLCTPNLWEQFVTNRSEYKKSALTKNALKTIHDEFKAWGVEKSDISLKTAIKGNHQGLFEPRISTSGNFGYQTQASTRMSEIQELIAQEEQGNATYGF